MAINSDAATQWEFIEIPAGEFMMGASPEDSEACSDEKPSHRVRISRSFQLGRFPVTQEMWESIMGSNPSGFKGKTRPVEDVSWNDTQEFINKVNVRWDGYLYRLPTEAEWEYSARAGTRGSRYGDLHSIAWFNENSGSQTHPVGEKLPNRFGLYDMLGNVFEWCQDWYNYNYYEISPTNDPMGPEIEERRILRGGAYYVDSSVSRVSNRNSNFPEYSSVIIGFRLCREKF